MGVWAGYSRISGLLFIQKNLTGKLYLNLIEEIINHLTSTSLANRIDDAGIMIVLQNLIQFQQDGALPHYILPVAKGQSKGSNRIAKTITQFIEPKFLPMGSSKLDYL